MTRQKERSRIDMKKIVIASSFFICFGILAAGLTQADTVIMKDGKEVKGIVLEEYKDRMLISTVDGERSLMKEEIKELYFDTEEQNLIKLAEQARDKGDFVKSLRITRRRSRRTIIQRPQRTA